MDKDNLKEIVDNLQSVPKPSALEFNSKNLETIEQSLINIKSSIVRFESYNTWDTDNLGELLKTMDTNLATMKALRHKLITESIHKENAIREAKILDDMVKSILQSLPSSKQVLEEEELNSKLNEMIKK